MVLFWLISSFACFSSVAAMRAETRIHQGDIEHNMSDQLRKFLKDVSASPCMASCKEELMNRTHVCHGVPHGYFGEGLPWICKKRCCADPSYEKGFQELKRSSCDRVTHTMDFLDNQKCGSQTFGCDERYFDRVTCGAREFLFSRADTRSDQSRELLKKFANVVNPAAYDEFEDPMYTWLNKPPTETRFVTLVRSRPAVLKDMPFGKPQLTLRNADGSSMHMSENAGFVCLHGDQLIAVGGLDNIALSQGRLIEKGIRTAVANASILPLRWEQQHLAISGDPETTGCVEARAHKQVCEFDGKLSLAKVGQELLLYGRANLAENGGARHVQVSRSPAEWPPTFKRFELVYFDQHDPFDRDHNTYFLAAREVSVNGTHFVLAIYPMTANDLSGVFLSVSKDGVRFTHPIMLFPSPNFGARTSDQPVDIDSVQDNPDIAVRIPIATATNVVFGSGYESCQGMLNELPTMHEFTLHRTKLLKLLKRAEQVGVGYMDPAHGRQARYDVLILIIAMIIIVAVAARRYVIVERCA